MQISTLNILITFLKHPGKTDGKNYGRRFYFQLLDLNPMV